LGNVGIGTTSPGYKLQVGSAGDGTEAIANAWNVLSDSSTKTNVVTIHNALKKVLNLRGAVAPHFPLCNFFVTQRFTEERTLRTTEKKYF
jgi:hypothetical protein